MLIVGYCFGIRSERRLCEEVHLNLAYRWFCRLGLEDRGAGSLDVLQEPPWPLPGQRYVALRVREGRCERCMTEGLVGGEGFAIDASLVQADANRQRGVPGAEAAGRAAEALSRAVREYLAALEQAEPRKTPPKNISLTDPAAQWTRRQADRRSTPTRPTI